MRRTYGNSIAIQNVGLCCSRENYHKYFAKHALVCRFTLNTQHNEIRFISAWLFSQQFIRSYRFDFRSLLYTIQRFSKNSDRIGVCVSELYEYDAPLNNYIFFYLLIEMRQADFDIAAIPSFGMVFAFPNNGIIKMYAYLLNGTRMNYVRVHAGASRGEMISTKFTILS